MMVSLDFQMLKITANPDSRSTLYYDKYQYKMSMHVPHVGRMRNLDHNAIDHSINYYNSVSFRSFSHRVTTQDRDYLHTLATTLTAGQVDHKRVIHSDWINIYTNDTDFLNSICELAFIKTFSYSQAVVDLPKDVVLLRHSDYKFRTYLKDRFLDEPSQQRLRTFLLDRTDYFRMTRGTLDRLKKSGRFFYTTSWIFLDHHSEHDALMLNLVVPGIVRKTMPIQTK